MLEENSLNDLIRRFRECKTAAEERKFINKERGEIRLYMKDWGLEQKADAILRLIWINMMGYETNFAQVECMNALFFEDFRIKIIGYLGLTLFLSEKSEVLMMATNRIRIDLENKDNFFIIALALKTFSEIADKNMTVDLFQNIKELIKNDSKYIKKKAMLACIRVLQKEPSLVTEIKPILPYILNETNHGLLISSLQLAKQVIKLKPEYKKLFEDSLENLYEVLKTLQNEYQNQYQIEKINDPFLQTYILDFAKDIVNSNSNLSGEYEAQILMVYNNIKNDCSSSTLCLLYECARCIMQINSSLSLKKIGIQILGKFLEMKNTNNLYLSLKMLYYASAKYKDEIVKYDSLIQKCVRNSDFQIKRLAIMILKNISNQTNVNKIFEQIFQQYKKEKDLKQSKELFTILVQIIEKNPLSLQWYIEKILKLVQFSLSEIYDQDLFNYFDLISNHSELQQVFLCFLILLISDRKNWQNQSLIKSAFWVIGEFAELFDQNFKIDLNKIFEIFLQIDISEFQDLTSFYIFSCLAKIYVKIEKQNIQNQVQKCFIHYAQNCSSIQLLKIYQYLNLLKYDQETLEELFEPVPPASINEIFKDVQLGEIDQEQLKKNIELFNKIDLQVQQKESENIFEEESPSVNQSQNNNQQNQENQEFNFLDLEIEEKNDNKNQQNLDQQNQDQNDFDFLGQNDQQENQVQKNNNETENQDINLLDLDDQNIQTTNQQINEQKDHQIIDFFQEENQQQVKQKINDQEINQSTEELVGLNLNKPQDNDPYAFLDQNNINNNILDKEDDEFFEQDEIQEDFLPRTKFFENQDLILEYTQKKISSFQNQIKIYFTNKQLTPINQLNLKVAKIKKDYQKWQ